MNLSEKLAPLEKTDSLRFENDRAMRAKLAKRAGLDVAERRFEQTGMMRWAGLDLEIRAGADWAEITVKKRHPLSRWLLALREFEQQVSAARRGMKRLGGGSVDSDDSAAYDAEAAGYAKARELLVRLPADADATAAKTALTEGWPPGTDDLGLRTALAVIDGDAAAFYNAYHPRRKS